jgi:peptidoglycan/xylan/chitin deacetylase (PgdA/CDA1 family)
MKKSLLLIIILFYSFYVSAQFNMAWQGKKCAVVLTYDDALNVHLDNVIPLMDSLGLKGTFYLSAYSPGSRNRIADWRKAATKGYELANHTLFHPCIGSGAGREWVKPDYDMRNYTVQRMVDETRMTNVFLEAVDGKTKRTFAYTCGDMKIGDSSFINGMKNDFVAARAVRSQMHKIAEVDLYNVDCYAINGSTGAEMVELVKKAMETNSLLVFLFHGVGGEHPINVSLPAHKELLQFLKQNEKDIMIAPMLDVAEHIKNWQERDKTAKATQEDYKKMLAQLGIDSIRRGPSGNPAAPNAANTDEAKASPYTSLPDPLTLNNGKKVTNAKTWWSKRRPEIVELFDREIYGRVPKNLPKVTWEIVSSTTEKNGDYPVITKKLVGHVDNSAYPSIKVNIDLTLSTPADAKGPVPVMLEFGFIFPAGFRPPCPTCRYTNRTNMATTITCERLGLCYYCSHQLPG